MEVGRPLSSCLSRYASRRAALCVLWWDQGMVVRRELVFQSVGKELRGRGSGRGRGGENRRARALIGGARAKSAPQSRARGNAGKRQQHPARSLCLPFTIQNETSRNSNTQRTIIKTEYVLRNTARAAEPARHRSGTRSCRGFHHHPSSTPAPAPLRLGDTGAPPPPPMRSRALRPRVPRGQMQRARLGLPLPARKDRGQERGLRLCQGGGVAFATVFRFPRDGRG